MQAYRTTSAALAILSALLFLSLLLAFTDQNLELFVLAVPGTFLERAFSYAAFYVPTYLLAAAYLLVRAEFRPRDALCLTATTIPFLTASLAVKTAVEFPLSVPVRPFVLVFGRAGGATLLGLLSALFAVLIAGWWMRGHVRKDSVNAPAVNDREAVESSRADDGSAFSELRPILGSSRFFGGSARIQNGKSERHQEPLEAVNEELPSALDAYDALDVDGPLDVDDRHEVPHGASSIEDAEDLDITNREIPQPSPPLEHAEADDVSPLEDLERDADLSAVDEKLRIDELDADPNAGSAFVSDRVEDEDLTTLDDELDLETDEANIRDDVDTLEERAGDEIDETDAIDDDDEVDIGEVVDDGAVDVGDSLGEDEMDAGEALNEDEIDTGEALDDDEVDAGESLDDDEMDAGESLDDDEVDTGESLDDDEMDAGESLDDDDLAVSVDDAVEAAGSTDITKAKKSSPTEAERSSASKTTGSEDDEYEIPLDGLLDEYSDGQYWKIDSETQEAAEVLKNTLEEFKIKADVTGIRKGPVITMFEILPAPGVKLSKIVNLADNIALRLAASRVRIVAPIPGKHAVGIEVPNRHRAIVSFREMILDEGFNDDDYAIPLALGKDIPGEAQIIDLTKTPHLLIAGATGSGKSVCVNSIISSILYRRKPSEVKLMLIDPKIVELKLYNDIPHLLTPVITEPRRAFQALQYCLSEMERRYSLLDALGVRDIASFNKKIKKKRLATLPLPYIVIVVDEFADLMSNLGKDLETTLARLAAMSRAVGIHLVLATQRPSVDVITGLIKANIPSRIAFMVASKFDSRIIIDSVGAEKLLGRGDMLLTTAWNPNPVRIQGAFMSEEEVEAVTDYVKTLGEPDYIDEEIFIDEDEEGPGLFAEGDEDPLSEEALEIVVRAGKASASYLQRKLKIGYNRAARLVEDMEERGIVGPQQGSKPREVLRVPDR